MSEIYLVCGKMFLVKNLFSIDVEEKKKYNKRHCGIMNQEKKSVEAKKVKAIVFFFILRWGNSADFFFLRAGKKS